MTREETHPAPCWPSPWATRLASGRRSSSRRWPIPRSRRPCRLLVIGDRRILERAAGFPGIPCPPVEIVGDPARGRYQPGWLTLLDLANALPEECPVGQISAAAGRAAVEYVFAACDLATAGAAAAVVTAPLNKAAMNLAGYHYAGHTELLAERTGATRVSMLLVGPKLRVMHVSTHVSLEEAIRRVTRQRVEEVIEMADHSCRALGIAKPRIAVAGLNPHASEGGLFGDQEQREIVPAVEAARRRGLMVSDPQPPDTVFLRAVRGEFDIVVAMYHDQGHIPIKLLAFDDGVNVSIGLPIIRTSVDHGTAFDIAGSGAAREDSLLAAIQVALQMVQARDAAVNPTGPARNRREINIPYGDGQVVVDGATGQPAVGPLTGCHAALPRPGGRNSPRPGAAHRRAASVQGRPRRPAGGDRRGRPDPPDPGEPGHPDPAGRAEPGRGGRRAGDRADRPGHPPADDAG